MPVETNRLVLDGNVVGKISSRLLALGEKATGARTKLVSGAEALGTCWGDRDEFSRTFAKEYLPNRDKVFDASKNLGDFFTDLGQRVKAMDGSFSVTEQANI